MAFFLVFGDRVGLEVFDSFLIEALTSLKEYPQFKDIFGANAYEIGPLSLS